MTHTASEPQYIKKIGYNNQNLELIIFTKHNKTYNSKYDYISKNDKCNE
jgi:hypothetical protein